MSLRLAYLQVDLNIDSKAKMLAGELDVDPLLVEGVLNRLWRVGLQQGPEELPPFGMIDGSHAERRLLAALEWRGDREALLAALYEMGFIARTATGIRICGMDRYWPTWRAAEVERRRKARGRMTIALNKQGVPLPEAQRRAKEKYPTDLPPIVPPWAAAEAATGPVDVHPDGGRTAGGRPPGHPPDRPQDIQPPVGRTSGRKKENEKENENKELLPPPTARAPAHARVAEPVPNPRPVVLVKSLQAKAPDPSPEPSAAAAVGQGEGGGETATDPPGERWTDDAGGFWAYAQDQRAQKGLPLEPTRPKGFDAWFARARAQVEIGPLSGAFLRYLDDEHFAKRGWPTAVFISDAVWGTRTLDPPPRRGAR